MKKGKNRTKKISKWEIWATERAQEPYYVHQGRKFLFTAVVVGIALLIVGLFFFDTPAESVGAVLFGVGLLLWAGNLLVLSYGKIENEDDQFLMKCLVRVGGMLFGPALTVVSFGMGTGAAETRTWEEICLGAVIISAMSVLPFGLSLLKLILLRRKKKEPKSKGNKAPWE